MHRRRMFAIPIVETLREERLRRTRFDRIVLLIVLGAALLGCTSDPRYKEGLEWVQWQEAEKKRLDDAGFPQYVGSR